VEIVPFNGTTEMKGSRTTFDAGGFELAPNNRSYSFFDIWLHEMKRCFIDIGLQTAADDLNPLTPGVTDAAGNILTAISQGQYNAALTYAASAGLTYPNKSSVFRGIMRNSSKLGTAADAMPMLAVDIALLKGVVAEAKGCL
jgi:hypothetical protein